MDTALLKIFASLPADQSAIIKVMAVYYDYISLTALSRCLFHLGVKDGQKIIKTESLKTRLKALVKLGLLQESTKPGGTRCIRNIAESVVRQLVADSEFERYVEVVLKESGFGNGYYRYHSVEDCVRETRIFFYRADYDKAKQCISMGERLPGKIPELDDLYLSWFVNPLDGVWFKQHHPTFLPVLVALTALHQSLYLYRNDEIEAFLQNYFVDCLQDQTSVHFEARMLLEIKFLRGEWSDLTSALMGQEDPELQAMAAMQDFFAGNYAHALTQYETALAKLRKISGQRSQYFYGLAGLFYPLALIKIGDAKQRSKIATLLNQAIKIGSYWSNVYNFILLYWQFLQGDLSKRLQLFNIPSNFKISSGFRDNGVPESILTAPVLQHVLLYIIKFWMNAEAMNKVSPAYQQLYKHLAIHQYAWPMAELATVFSCVEPARAKQWNNGFFSSPAQALANLFVSRPDWELALDALANLPVSEKKSESVVSNDKNTRIVWLVDLDTDRQISMQAKEQKLTAKGSWSVGRVIALKRLAEETASFDYLSEQDLRLCKHIKEYRDNSWYGRGSYYEFDDYTPEAMIGHPALFLAESPGVRVEVVKGNVELHVKKMDDQNKIKIVLEPQPYGDQKFCIVKESPTRWRVVAFNADHQKIYNVLGINGLETPISAKDRVLQTLTGISSLLTVHSDFGGGSTDAEQRQADATPRMHLLPSGDGLRVSLLVRPFTNAGAYFLPGRGGENVLAEIEGKAVQTRRDLALEQQLAAEVIAACPVLAEAERDSGGDWLLEDPEPCLELLLQAQNLGEQQVRLEWPEGVRFKLLGQSTGSGFSLQIKRDNDWFALQGELQVDEHNVLDMQQLLGLLDNRHGRFLQLQNGQFLALTDEFRRRLEALRAYADHSGKKLRINPLAALNLEDWAADFDIKADKHWQAHLQKLQMARDYQPQLPSTFQAELRDYQMQGYQWLARLAHWGVGACLADDMGLGKTVQALALLVDRAPRGPALIVAPTSVCLNWEQEANRFAPTLNSIVLGSGDRQKMLDNLAAFDVLICSYGLLQQEQVADMLAQLNFATVILDEAQAIKNLATRRSQGAMNLQAEFKLIMTGTPLENHLGELWNLFRFINPGLLGSMEQFNKRFVTPIERDGDAAARQQLKKLIQPFILRRSKTQVLQELPPRTEVPIFVQLSPEEIAFYEALRRESLAVLSGVEAPAGQKHLQILAAITKLRRSCCHTQLVNPNIDLPSSKLTAFGEILDELLENRHKALVFSQFVDHLHIIKAYVEQRGVSYQYLDGSTPAKERQLRVQAFQSGDGDLFLISLKAGGVGLNLTAADYVIHMDPWWNPAVEDQASDRAHRMGQQRPVTIYRMIAKNTIEEKIVALHGHKRDLADSLLDGADISGKVSADDLLNLMRGEDAI